MQRWHGLKLAGDGGAAKRIDRLAVGHRGVDHADAGDQTGGRHRYQLDYEGDEGDEHQPIAPPGVLVAMANEHPHQEDTHARHVSTAIEQIRQLDQPIVGQDMGLQSCFVG
jgi:hypothetical protein